MDNLLHSAWSKELKKRYVYARDTEQRVEELYMNEDRRMISGLNLTVSRVSQTMNRISKVVQEIKAAVNNELETFGQKTWFHWRWGLKQLVYIARHDFLRGWEVISERSLDYVTVNYQENVAYAKDVVRRLTDPGSSLNDAARQALAVNVLGDLFQKQVVCERTLQNLTTVYNSYMTAEPLHHFKASPQRRYDRAYITIDIVTDRPDQIREYYKKIRMRLSQYLEALSEMEGIIQEALDIRVANMTQLDQVTSDFERAARSFNYYRFLFGERIARRPVELSEALMDTFIKLNYSLQSRRDEINVFLDQLTLSLDDADTSWQDIVDLNSEALLYLKDSNMTKTNLAERFNSPSTARAVGKTRSFLSKVKSRLRDIESMLTRLELAYVLLWRNMLNEHTLDYFYGNISQDIDVLSGESGGDLERENILEVFAIMLNRNRNDIEENVTNLAHLTNGNFVTMTTGSKINQVEEFFQRLKDLNNIENVMKDEEEFFDAANSLGRKLLTFLRGNDINEAFFA